MGLQDLGILGVMSKLHTNGILLCVQGRMIAGASQSQPTSWGARVVAAASEQQGTNSAAGDQHLAPIGAVGSASVAKGQTRRGGERLKGGAGQKKGAGRSFYRLRLWRWAFQKALNAVSFGRL